MISHRIYIITLGPEMIQESKCCGSNRSCVLALRASAHERLEPQRFFYRWNETFCFKRKRAHGRLFYRSVFPNTSCFIFCAVRWPHSGWRWQWTRRNIPACAHERRNNRTATSIRLPYQAIAHIMDLRVDFKNFHEHRSIGRRNRAQKLHCSEY